MEYIIDMLKEICWLLLLYLWI